MPPSPDLSALHLESTLPTLPAAALEVLRVCQDPDAEIGELAQALALDPMLAGRVLRVANSAFYHRRSEVTTLRGAAMVLGMRALKIVALGFTLANELPRRGVTAGLDLSVYWHRSIVNGVIARSVARSVNRNLVEEAFLCGLLSEIGKLALTQAMPDTYAPVVLEGEGWPTGELERERLGFAASEAAEVILRGWQVPEVVVVGAAFADRPEALGDERADRRLPPRRHRQPGPSRHGRGIRRRPGKPPDRLHRAGRAALRARGRRGSRARRATRGRGARGSRHALARPSAGRLVRGAARPGAPAHALDVGGDRRQARGDIAHGRGALARERASRGAGQHRRAHRLAQPRRAQRVPHAAGAPEAPRRPARPPRRDHDRHRQLQGLQRPLRPPGRRRGAALRRRWRSARSSGAATSWRATAARSSASSYPHATTETLAAAGERLRQTIEAHDVDLGSLGHQHVTASFGCALLADVTRHDDGLKLVAAADVQLYAAKNAGRNRVAIAADPFVSA